MLCRFPHSFGARKYRYVRWDAEQFGIDRHPFQIFLLKKKFGSNLINHKTYVIANLKASRAELVYNITDPANPIYDSGAITELNDYTKIEGLSSAGEPEGLAYKNGYVLVANTEDPSVALLKASWAE